SEPPVDKIRSALASKIMGEISVQQISGKPEVLVGTEIKDEKELNANRQLIEDTLRATFSDTNGKLDVNNSSAEQLAGVLRAPLLDAGVSMSEQELQEVVRGIEDYRANHGGILKAFTEVSGVKGVTPQVIQAMNKACSLGPFTVLSAEVVGPK